jgi:hypothetical protein
VYEGGACASAAPTKTLGSGSAGKVRGMGCMATLTRSRSRRAAMAVRADDSADSMERHVGSDPPGMDPATLRASDMAATPA